MHPNHGDGFELDQYNNLKTVFMALYVENFLSQYEKSEEEDF